MGIFRAHLQTVVLWYLGLPEQSLSGPIPAKAVEQLSSENLINHPFTWLSIQARCGHYCTDPDLGVYGQVACAHHARRFKTSRRVRVPGDSCFPADKERGGEKKNLQIIIVFFCHSCAVSLGCPPMGNTGNARTLLGLYSHFSAGRTVQLFITFVAHRHWRQK